MDDDCSKKYYEKEYLACLSSLFTVVYVDELENA